MVKGDSGAAPGHWAIKGADAQTGTLKTYWDGHRAPRYAPMKKQGAIILGIGGDNSDGAVYASRTPHSGLILSNISLTSLRGRCRGTFYEGVMTKGYSSNATDAAVQQDIVSAGYGK